MEQLMCIQESNIKKKLIWLQNLIIKTVNKLAILINKPTH